MNITSSINLKSTIYLLKSNSNSVHPSSSVVKTLLTVFLLLIAKVAFTQTTQTTAQEAPASALMVSDLNIGDQIPDFEFCNVLNNDGDPIKISDYKGKILILDFWATWCAPCIASFPKLDSLDKAFGEQFAVVPVTYQSKDEVEKLFTRMDKLKNIKKPMIYSDDTLRFAFPHTTLPYYVWIDQESRVVAFTNSDEINTNNIQKAIAGNFDGIRNDQQQANQFERSRPIRDQVTESSKPIYQSGLWGYIPGFPSMASIATFFEEGDHNVRIFLTNIPLLDLFRYSHRENGKSLNRKNIDVTVRNDDFFKDISGFNHAQMQEWTEKYCFSYELEVERKNKDKIWDIFKDDLKAFFPQYKAEMETREVPCFALIANGNHDLKSNGGQPIAHVAPYEAIIQNKSIGHLVSHLNLKYLQHLDKMIINQTGITTPIDLHLQCNMSDIEEIKEALKPYGLNIIETSTQQEILVISDNN